MSRIKAVSAFLIPKLKRIGQFFGAQGITMVSNLFYGFLCVRLLAIPDYAMYVVVFSFLGSLGVFMDTGISGSLVPLVGDQVDDKQLVADYVASLRQLSRKIFFFMGPAAAILYPLFVRNRGWSWPVIAVMILILLISVWFSQIGASYGYVLIMRRDMGRWYREQLISSLGTLALLLLFWALHWLTALSAVLINVSGILYVGFSYYLRARLLLGVQGTGSKVKRKAIVHLALPNIVNVLFYAVRGQIPIYLITLFGATAAVASVGALNRLGQGFLLFSQMNWILIAPYFSKLPRKKLLPHYLLAVGAACGISFSAIILAWLYPEVFLWILGHKYSNLRHSVLLIMIGGAIGYLSGVIWVIHSARKFIYWWSNIATIVLTVLVQVIYIWKHDLSTVDSNLTLNIYSAAAGFIICILCAFYGFVFGPRELKVQQDKAIAQ